MAARAQSCILQYNKHWEFLRNCIGVMISESEGDQQSLKVSLDGLVNQRHGRLTLESASSSLTAFEAGRRTEVALAGSRVGPGRSLAPSRIPWLKRTSSHSLDEPYLHSYTKP